MTTPIGPVTVDLPGLPKIWGPRSQWRVTFTGCEERGIWFKPWEPTELRAFLRLLKTLGLAPHVEAQNPLWAR